MEEEDRVAALKQVLVNDLDGCIQDMAGFCQTYPSLQMAFTHELRDNEVHVNVAFDREDEQEMLTFRYFPKEVEENWWVLVGDNKLNKLHVIKRVKVLKNTNVTLVFNAPEPGTYQLTLYLICDCFIGCDQGEKFELVVPSL